MRSLRDFLPITLIFFAFSCASSPKKMHPPRAAPVIAGQPGPAQAIAPRPNLVVQDIPLHLPVLSLKSPSPVYARFSRLKILELSESFSMTHEIPVMKLNALKYLHQQLEFDVVNIQASAVDAWLGMNTLLTHDFDAQGLTLAKELTYPQYWQTTEMESLLRYIQLHRNEHPVYLSGFESRLGESSGFNNHFIIPLLASAFRNYGLKVPLDEIKSKLQPLLGLRNCKNTGFPKNPEEVAAVKNAAQIFGQWATQIEPAVSKKFPRLPHGAMLTLLPQSIQNNLELCLLDKNAAKPNGIPATWQKREEQNANFILEILKTVAHEEHLLNWTLAETAHYNTLKRTPPTHSEILKLKLQNDYYLVGFFPVNGEAILDGAPPRIFNLNKEQSNLQLFFSKSLKDPSFLETKQTNYFQLEAGVWMEGVLTSMALGRDFDGMIVLPQMTRPQWVLKHLLKQ